MEALTGVVGTVYAFIIGLFFGSFANVCIYRIPRKESVVRPRSKCPSCGQVLGVFDLIPLLSWLWLRRRCRYCGERIAARYFLVELLTGIVFCWTYVRFGLEGRWWDLAIFLALNFALLVIFFIDLEHKIIPNEINFAYVIVGIVAAVMPHYPWTGEFDTVTSTFGSLVHAVTGGFLGLFILLGIERVGYWAYGKPAMGMGDVKLALVLGLFLGWRLLLLALFASFLYGAVIGLILVAFRVVGKRDYIPFGPYLVLGAFTVIVYGPEMINWYFQNPPVTMMLERWLGM